MRSASIIEFGVLTTTSRSANAAHASPCGRFRLAAVLGDHTPLGHPGGATRPRCQTPQQFVRAVILSERPDLFKDEGELRKLWSDPSTRKALVERLAEKGFGTHNAMGSRFADNQLAFLDFVLAHYVREGVDELDPDKLTPLLKLKYHNAIVDAVQALGDAETIRHIFTDFQRFLYQPRPSAKKAVFPQVP